MPGPLQDALDNLIADPKSFLESHYLGTSGSAVAGPQTYWLQEVSAMRSVRFADQAKYQMGPFALHGGPKIALPVIGIPMLIQNQVNLGALAGIPLPQGGIAKIAVTGQLSGCSYFVARTNIGLLATHIKPTGVGGDELHTQMARNARFSNNGATHPYINAAVFGKQFYGIHATVIGVNGPGGWGFWAQLNNGMSKDIQRVMRVL